MLAKLFIIIVHALVLVNGRKSLPFINSFQKISDTEGNFTATLNDDDDFGVSIASIGDLNNDGINDIAVGADQDDDGSTGDNSRGAV